MKKGCPCGRPLDSKGAKGLCHRCYEKKRYADDPVRGRRINSASYKKHRTVRLAGQKRWRKANPEKKKASDKAYAQTGKYSAYQKAYRQRNKAALRAKTIAKKFKIPVELYLSMIESHKGRCAICNGKPSKKKFLCVDHNHRTKKVRGLLCSQCNLALGLLRDSEALLKAALRYLNYHCN
jgi:hypothetical protein